MPSSDVNKEYYIQNQEKLMALEDGQSPRLLGLSFLGLLALVPSVPLPKSCSRPQSPRLSLLVSSVSPHPFLPLQVTMPMGSWPAREPPGVRLPPGEPFWRSSSVGTPTTSGTKPASARSGSKGSARAVTRARTGARQQHSLLYLARLLTTAPRQARDADGSQRPAGQAEHDGPLPRQGRPRGREVHAQDCW